MSAKNTRLYRVRAVVPSKLAKGNENWIHTDCTYMDARTLTLEYMRRGGWVCVHPEKRQKRGDLWAGMLRRGKGWVRCLIPFLIAAGLSGSMQAAETDTTFRWATVSFGAAVFADAWTSERAFDAGHGEMNPTLPEHPTDSRFFAQVIVFDSAVYLYARHLHAKHPALARWVLIGGAAIHFAAASHNDRIWDSQQ